MICSSAESYENVHPERGDWLGISFRPAAPRKRVSHAHAQPKAKNCCRLFFNPFPDDNRQLQALFKRLAELDKAISILKPLNTTDLLETARRKSATEDNLSLQGDHDPDRQELSPSTSRRGSRRSDTVNEEAASAKRKHGSGGSSGGHQQEPIESGTIEGRDDNNGRRRTKTPSRSSKGTVGASILARTTKDQREEAMASLLTLIDENTATVDTDTCSLASTESVSTAS